MRVRGQHWKRFSVLLILTSSRIRRNRSNKDWATLYFSLTLAFRFCLYCLANPPILSCNTNTASVFYSLRYYGYTLFFVPFRVGTFLLVHGPAWFCPVLKGQNWRSGINFHICCSLKQNEVYHYLGLPKGSLTKSHRGFKPLILYRKKRKQGRRMVGVTVC